MNDLLKLKLELKNLAKTICIQKNKRCKKNNGYISGLSELRQYYRHRHVLYCLARGRTLEQCDSGINLNMSYINFQLSAMKEDKKLYIVVDKNLPIRVQVVQACHVVAEFMKNNPATMWKNGTIVLLKSDKHHGLAKYRFLPYEYASFSEPDLEGVCTAHAIFGPGVESDLSSLLLV